MGPRLKLGRVKPSPASFMLRLANGWNRPEADLRKTPDDRWVHSAMRTSAKSSWWNVLRGYLVALPIVLAIGALVYYVYIPNSAGFEAARSVVTDLPDVQSRVGQVQQVTVLAFRPFRERFVGSDRFVLLSLGVRGDRGQMKVRIRMVRSNDKWRVDYWKIVD